jgi:hypothetical protein
MTVSEYEFFGVTPDRQTLFGQVLRSQLSVLRHQHGESIDGPVPRVQQIEWCLDEYRRTGDRSQLVTAAAWLAAEWCHGV